MKILRLRGNTLLALVPLITGCDYIEAEGKSEVEKCFEAQMAVYAAEKLEKLAQTEAQNAALAAARTRRALLEQYAPNEEAVTSGENDKRSYSLDEFFPDDAILAKATPEQAAQMKEEGTRAEIAGKKYEEAELTSEKARAEARAWLLCLHSGRK